MQRRCELELGVPSAAVRKKLQQVVDHGKTSGALGRLEPVWGPRGGNRCQEEHVQQMH